VVSAPSCGKRAKLYESTGASKRLASSKLHEKSLAMLETCEFHSHSHRYPGTCHLYSPNYSLSYQFRLTESLCLLTPTFQGSDTEVLNYIQIWSVV